jgi:uncharacterized membrane protein YphA (DoxX/SURF4 family)
MGARVSSVLLFILIAVAIVKMHLARGFFLAQGGLEYNFIIVSVLVALLLIGTGKLGLNKKF